MNKSDKIDQLAAALAKAQGDMKNPPLDGTNPHFNSRFATLAGVRDAVLPVLARHGLSVIQSAGSGEQGPTLTTLLLHTSGQWVETDALCLPAAKRDAQGYGSAITYGRRYSLMALAGVVGDDDDGQAAAQQAAPPRRKAEAPAVANGQAGPLPAAPKQGPKPPETAGEFQAWVCDRDAYLAKKGVCKGGELVAAVLARGEPKGYPGDLAAWPKDGWALAGKAVRDFEAARARPAGSAP